MIRIAGIKEDVLVTLQIIGDLSYAWEIVEAYTEFMQEGVKEDPSLVKKLRATFLKVLFVKKIKRKKEIYIW